MLNIPRDNAERMSQQQAQVDAHPRNNRPPLAPQQVGTRGLGFNSREVSKLLSLIEDVIPVSAGDWGRVRSEHEKAHPGAGRTAESLRRKFHTMHRRSRSNRRGSAVSPEVARARRIKRIINEKRDGARPDDGENLRNNSDEEVGTGNDHAPTASGASEDGEDGGEEQEEEEGTTGAVAVDGEQAQRQEHRTVRIRATVGTGRRRSTSPAGSRAFPNGRPLRKKQKKGNTTGGSSSGSEFYRFMMDRMVAEDGRREEDRKDRERFEQLEKERRDEERVRSAQLNQQLMLMMQMNMNMMNTMIGGRMGETVRAVQAPTQVPGDDVVDAMLMDERVGRDSNDHLQYQPES